MMATTRRPNPEPIRQRSVLDWLGDSERCPKGITAVAVFAYMTAVGVADYITGFETSFAVFYLLGLGVAAWLVGRGFGFALSAATVGMWIVGDGGAGTRFLQPAVTVWNAGIVLVVCALVVWLADYLRNLRQEINARVRRRTLELTQETERLKRVEEMLRESEDRFRALADAAFEGIIIHDGGKIVEVNRGAAEIFGYAPSEVAGKSFLQLVVPAAQDLVQSAIASGFDEPYEVPGLRKDGSHFEIQIRGGVIRYQERMRRVAAIRDLTHSRRALKQIMQLKEQTAVEAERSRIARDMHDALGAGLTQIKLLGELLDHDATLAVALRPRVQTISRTARELAESVDQIVWAVNPEKDRLENLAFYLGNYTEHLLAPTSVRCRLDIPSVLPDIALAAGVRHRVFLAAKEALNNALKHAQATEIRLKLAVERNRFRVCVEDNGCGFRLNVLPSQRNGLNNIRQGLAEVDGMCSIETEPGRGTCVDLSVRL